MSRGGAPWCHHRPPRGLEAPFQAVPRPSYRETPETSPHPILSRMSRPRIAALRLAASRCGRQPLGTGAAAIAASEGRPAAGGAGMPQGCFQGCAPEGPALKCLLKYLYVVRPIREGTHPAPSERQEERHGTVILHLQVYSLNLT